MNRTWTIFSLVVVGVLLGGQSLLNRVAVPLPGIAPFAKQVWLDQNWSQDQRDFFHYASQGSSTFGIPYEWFVALERPVLSLSSPGLLSDSDYLDRLGFIPAGGGRKRLPSSPKASAACSSST